MNKDLKNEKKDDKGRKLTIRIACKTEIKVVDESKGIIKAYVSIFGNVDSYGDIILRGAFLESIAKKLPKMVWSHDWTQPIGKTLSMGEDDKGLLAEGQFNLETQRGKEAYSDLKFGSIDEFSIGLRVLDWEYNEQNNRIIKKAKLYEWSPVLAGANPDTELISIKSEGDEEVVEGEPVAPVEESAKPADEVVEPEKSEKKEEPAPAPAVAPVEDEKAMTGEQAESLLTKINDFITALSPIKAMLEKSAAGTKVEADHGAIKILRIRQAVKQIDKSAEAILRITKQK